MNSNLGQEFEDIRLEVLQVQQYYAKGYSLVNSIVDRISSLELLAPKIYLYDLSKLKQDLYLIQTSQLKAINEQLIQQAVETIEASLYRFHKTDYFSLNFTNDSETFQSLKSDGDKYFDKDFCSDEVGPSQSQIHHQSLVSPSNSQLSSEIHLNKNIEASAPIRQKLKNPGKRKASKKSKARSQSAAKPERGNYHIATKEDKAYAIALAEAKGLRAAAEETGFVAKNIKRWMTTGPQRKKGGGRKTMDPEMEEKLYKWILHEEKENKQLLTRCQIKQKAKEISVVKAFKASKGWLDKFRRRFNVKVRPAVSESQFNESEMSPIGKEDDGDASIIDPSDIEIDEENKTHTKCEQDQSQMSEEIYQEQEPNATGASHLDKDLLFKNFDVQNFLSLTHDHNFDINNMGISLDSSFFLKKEDQAI